MRTWKNNLLFGVLGAIFTAIVGSFVFGGICAAAISAYFEVLHVTEGTALGLVAKPTLNPSWTDRPPSLDAIIAPTQSPHAPSDQYSDLVQIALFCLAFGLGGAFVALHVAIPAILLVGLPVHALLQWRRLTSAGTYVCSGFIAGVVLDLVLDLAYSLILGGGFSPETLFILIAPPLIAPLTAHVFWRIVRPDLKPKPDPAASVDTPDPRPEASR